MREPGPLNHPVGSHLLPRNTPFELLCWWETGLCFGTYLSQLYLIQSNFLTFASAPSGLSAGLGQVDFETEADFCWHTDQVWWDFQSFLVSSLVPNTPQLPVGDAVLPVCGSWAPSGSWSQGGWHCPLTCLTPETGSWLQPFWTFNLSLKSCLYSYLPLPPISSYLILFAFRVTT